MAMRIWIGVAAAVLATSALAQQHDYSPKGGTTGLQGDVQSFMYNDHMRAFHALAVETMKGGVDEAEIADFEKKSYVIFGEFAVSRGMKPQGMIDHLKAIPRQVIGIAKEDPQALATFDNFVAAMVGPP
jgi:hypothetical protein